MKPTPPLPYVSILVLSPLAALSESLWDELMSRGGITSINSTYGTLINVYSNGHLMEQALLWLDKMNKQGMGPHEITLGVVIQTYKKVGQFEKVGNSLRTGHHVKL